MCIEELCDLCKIKDGCEYHKDREEREKGMVTLVISCVKYVCKKKVKK